MSTNNCYIKFFLATLHLMNLKRKSSQCRKEMYQVWRALIIIMNSHTNLRMGSFKLNIEIVLKVHV